jgi:hypothetical protein
VIHVDGKSFSKQNGWVHTQEAVHATHVEGGCEGRLLDRCHRYIYTAALPAVYDESLGRGREKGGSVGAITVSTVEVQLIQGIHPRCRQTR